jgi:hypothetical protein
MLVRHALQHFIQNDGDFVDVTFLHCYPAVFYMFPPQRGNFAFRELIFYVSHLQKFIVFCYKLWCYSCPQHDNQWTCNHKDFVSTLETDENHSVLIPRINQNQDNFFSYEFMHLVKVRIFWHLPIIWHQQDINGTMNTENYQMFKPFNPLW